LISELISAIPVPLLLIGAMLFAAYSFVIRRCNRILMQLLLFKARGISKDKVTVVIAARNEEACIGACLDSLLQQSLPAEQCEVIVVDDGSDDHTAAIVSAYASRGVKLIRLTEVDRSGKKAALRKGIAAATNGIIVTTDADCSFDPGWLNTLLLFRQEKQAVFVAAPVRYSHEKSFLDRFQSLDFLSLQAITAAAVSARLFNMCNGANLLYTRAAYDAVGGFEGNDHIASGDDMFMMEKMAATFPGQVHFCYAEDAIVTTAPAGSWRAFIRQRIRWASKSTYYRHNGIKLVLLLVYLVNSGLTAMMLMLFFLPQYLPVWLFMVLMKGLIEFPLMIRIARFFNKTHLLPWFIPIQPLHALYTVLAGGFGMIGSYEWKGRKEKRLNSPPEHCG
jgi:cellulose synthase/poly-beta-1,6-N-acetylglucosamine synthase-like glycosyltransferase